ncbi:sporulation integral membrane protein YtvI [Tumebacillus permanentifrigoris]|uniref:Sporulation integral membrane protein YtvI n=1 Tax=Tumebacillus permanentifrigoris TaxID=378543 RepID=A0A316DB98_9BACL|nr:sporulation integral membrane protein YtvI [Tumebacillus permanentifrigoris]PWK11304.1 sporulation integral membrane protein YtvI [Tumebacillus permanentifrigoris]
MLSFVTKHFLSIVNLVLWLGFAWLVLISAKWVLPFILPLLFGILIAILIEPLVKFLHTLRLPRSLASLTTLVVFFGGSFTLVTLLIAKLVIELADFAKRVPEMTAGLVNQAQTLVHTAVDFYGTLSPEMSAKVQETMQSIAHSLTKFGQGLLTSMTNTVLSIPSTVTIFLLSLLIAFFISKDFRLWQVRFLRLIHPEIRKRGDIVLDDLGKATFGYARAQLILIFITYVQALVGLLILRVEYAFTLSLLAAFLDILPLLGTGSLFVPWALYMLATGNTKLGIGLLIVYGLIVAVRQVLEPKVLAESIGLDPLVTLVVMYASFQALGFVGVILAPFLIIIFNSLMKVRAFDFLLDHEKTNT